MNAASQEMQSEQRACDCTAAGQHIHHGSCTVSEKKGGGLQITSQPCRPHNVQALQQQKHTHVHGSLGECLLATTAEESGSPPGCDNRDDSGNRYQGSAVDAISTSMNPQRQPTALELEAPATTLKAPRRWGLHNIEQKERPRASSRERACWPVLNTDMLVKVACSAVEKAIRAHHASLECAKEASFNGVEKSNLALTAAPAYSRSASASSLCVMDTSTLNPFLSRVRTKNMSRQVWNAPSHAPSVLLSDRSSMEQSKRVSAMAMKPKGVESQSVAPRGRVHWRARLANTVESRRYDHILGILILSNALFLGICVEISSNRRTTDESQSLRVIGMSYAVFFFLELLLRISALGPRFFRPREAPWNVFDLIVICLSTGQAAFDFMVYHRRQSTKAQILHALRCLRVLRAARVLRTFRLFRPLRFLLTAILGTLTSCFWALLFLFSIIYLFSITFTDAANHHLYATGDDQDEGDTFFYFGSMFRSADTLFQAICGGVSWGEPLRVVSTFRGTGTFCVTVFYLYIGFTYFAVLNVVTALFCQFAVEHSLTDQEVVIDSKRKEIKYVQNKLQELFKELGEVDPSEHCLEGMVTLDDLETFLSVEGVQAKFSQLGIEPQDAWNLFKLLDEDGGGMVSNDEFISGCLRLRGDAKRIDISLLAYDIEASLMRLDVFMDHVVRRLEI